MDSRQERERLKEEYKEHYRAIRESRKKLEQYERKAKIASALEQIDPTPVIDGLHNALGKLREKVTMAEARLEVYLDEHAPKDAQALEEADEFEKKLRAKQSLDAIRQEMGNLEREADDKAAKLEVEKTISTHTIKPSDSGHGRISPNIVKTIGKKDEEN